MRVLVCGSRTFSDVGYLRTELYDRVPPGSVIIQGDAPGADTLAKEWAVVNQVPHEDYPADWKKYGKRAGPIRNAQMLDEGKPELVIAFTDKPLEDSRGTHNMVQQARRVNVPVEIHEVC